MEIHINNKLYFTVPGHLTHFELTQYIYEQVGLNSPEYYLLNRGKRLDEDDVISSGTIQVVPRILGGKGGFGSMLRAIGAQIEKTTNREACRDLSGRRLRDINEEQRLKNWINQQAEREKEAKERKKKKLERLCEKPKHEFRDAEYDKERSELPEKVEDAVLQGLQASCSTKRKVVEKREPIKKKKAKLWVDDELDDDISSSGDDSGSGDDDKLQIDIKNVESESTSSVSSSTPNIATENSMQIDSDDSSSETSVEKENAEEKVDLSEETNVKRTVDDSSPKPEEQEMNN